MQSARRRSRYQRKSGLRGSPSSRASDIGGTIRSLTSSSRGIALLLCVFFVFWLMLAVMFVSKTVADRNHENEEQRRESQVIDHVDWVDESSSLSNVIGDNNEMFEAFPPIILNPVRSEEEKKELFSAMYDAVFHSFFHAQWHPPKETIILKNLDQIVDYLNQQGLLG